MSDLSIEAKELVLDLINEDNGTRLTAEQVALIPPVSVSPDLPGVTMRVEALPTFTHSGSVVVSYNRLQLQQVIDRAGGMAVLTERTVTFEQFIGLIAELYNINFSASELEPDGVFDLSQGYAQTDVKVKAKEGSYAYYGNGVIVAHFEFVPIPIDEIESATTQFQSVVKNGLWNIFNPPQGP